MDWVTDYFILYYYPVLLKRVSEGAMKMETKCFSYNRFDAFENIYSFNCVVIFFFFLRIISLYCNSNMKDIYANNFNLSKNLGGGNKIRKDI